MRGGMNTLLDAVGAARMGKLMLLGVGGNVNLETGGGVEPFSDTLPLEVSSATCTAGFGY